jgi:mannobiose 2-epimerase
LDHIVDAQTHHLILFFDEQWNSRSTEVSYGHDIEAAWLIQEAAEVIGDEALIQKVKDRSVKIAEAAAKGLDRDGGLWYEFNPSTNHLVKEKHWWPQSEAMVGFYNAWQNTGDPSFLEASINSWSFTKRYIIDNKGGEWFWGVKEDYSVMQEDKVGLWKCPYHNSRACIEILQRIDSNNLF